MAEFNEFIYYSKEKDFANGDFSGAESVLSKLTRKKFLKEYAKAAYRRVGTDDKQKATKDYEVQETLKVIPASVQGGFRNTITFDKMFASKRKKADVFKSWQYYATGVSVENKTVNFRDGDTPPVANAKYTFDSVLRLRELEFEFCIGNEFKGVLTPRPLVTTVSGRTFELRSGLEDIVKLHVYINGDMVFRSSKKSKYHLENILLAKNVIGDNHRVRLILAEETCTVLLDGETVGVDLPLRSNSNPDTFFISGGMHPQGVWSVRPIRLTTDENSITDFFEPAIDLESEIEQLGEVSLPFALGTEKNKDCELIFEAEFDAIKGKRTLLSIDSIDPCGCIYINNQLVRQVDNFLSFRFFIDEYIREEKNSLKIIVEPRAPEIFYTWHRHKDPYNAWFLSGAKIEFVDDVYITHLNVETNFITDKCANVTLSGELSECLNSSIDFSYHKSFPHLESDIFIGKAEVNGNKFTAQFKLNAELWSPKNPVLYKFTATLKADDGTVLDEFSEDSGIRTIKQADGAIFLNNERILLNGALIMQFLPPYEDIPVNHLCPSDYQIAQQLLYAKNMNSNAVRLHQLGYGTNDKRFAVIADRLGIMLVWTTRLIDSLETRIWNGKWRQGEAFAAQIRDVYNHPSIIMWEGANEFHARLSDIDNMYDDFVSAVSAVDNTRLICPVSHLYYGGGVYDEIACQYYSDDGKRDQDFNPANSSVGWLAKNVIRSAHTYCILLGYGSEWKRMREQDWAMQDELFNSRERAYIVSEFAVIGRQNPETDEAKEYINTNSYELGDELNALGFSLSDNEWRLSQAHQDLCARHIVKKLRFLDVDGMFWCCLTGGANDASYLKPPIDFYGYKKLAFYGLKEGYEDVFCALYSSNVLYGKSDEFVPALVSLADNKTYNVEISFIDKAGVLCYKKEYKNVTADSHCKKLDGFRAEIKSGYYTVNFKIVEVSKK